MPFSFFMCHILTKRGDRNWYPNGTLQFRNDRVLETQTEIFKPGHSLSYTSRFLYFAFFFTFVLPG